MRVDLEAQKAELRKHVRAQLAKLSEADRIAAAEQIYKRLEQHPLWQRANIVLLYAPIAGEPDVWPLLHDAIAGGKIAALPSFHDESGAYKVRRVQDVAKDVMSGQYGIREPHSFCPEVVLNELDLVLVPGLAYDLNGHRLGRGKGYYDRLLATIHGLKCGVAFDTQVVAAIPTGPHDIRLNCILTPTRWIET